MEALLTSDVLLVVISAVITVVGGFAVRWLNAKAVEAKNNGDATMWARLDDIVYATAASVGERIFPKIAQAVKDGSVKDKDEIKKQLYEMGNIALEEVRAVFPEAVSRFGSAAVMAKIRSAADNVSPFPGLETSTALLNGGADKILTEGVRTAA